MIENIIFMADNVYKDSVKLDKNEYNLRDRKIDKIITSKVFGIPIMICFLAVVFWITIIGANYPSEWLSQFFNFIQDKLIDLFNFFICTRLVKGIID